MVLAGCGNLQNISATDIRNPEHLRAEKTFPLSIAQISQALYEHQAQCRDAGRVVQSPANPNEALITMEMPGRSKASVAVLIDLRQEGSTTQAKGYSYYSAWKGHVETIFKAIESPADCG
ncbi:hypothetical protein D3C71_1684510 [compost metagenome]